MTVHGSNSQNATNSKNASSNGRQSGRSAVIVLKQCTYQVFDFGSGHLSRQRAVGPPVGDLVKSCIQQEPSTNTIIISS